MFQGLIACDCQSVLQAGILSERNEIALLSLLPPRRRDVDAAILNTELVPRSQWIDMNLICRRRSVPMSEPGLSYALTWDSVQSYFYPSITSRRRRHRGLESQPQASVSVDVDDGSDDTRRQPRYRRSYRNFRDNASPGAPLFLDRVRECFHAGVPATGEVICEEIATCILDSGEFARLGCERETRLYQDFRDQTVKLPITPSLSDTTHSARTKTFLQAKYGNTLAKVLPEPHLSFRLLEKESLLCWPPITVVGDICKHCTNSSRGTTTAMRVTGSEESGGTGNRPVGPCIATESAMNKLYHYVPRVFRRVLQCNQSSLRPTTSQCLFGAARVQLQKTTMNLEGQVSRLVCHYFRLCMAQRGDMANASGQDGQRGL